jgi:hypothetical protein
VATYRGERGDFFVLGCHFRLFLCLPPTHFLESSTPFVWELVVIRFANLTE